MLDYLIEDHYKDTEFWYEIADKFAECLLAILELTNVDEIHKAAKKALDEEADNEN